jgi:hypothetical protein
MQPLQSAGRSRQDEEWAMKFIIKAAAIAAFATLSACGGGDSAAANQEEAMDNMSDALSNQAENVSEMADNATGAAADSLENRSEAADEAPENGVVDEAQ